MNKSKCLKSENEPNIAVILAAFNGEQWISEQITTVLSQRAVNVTVYVSIDDCSDSTAEVVKTLSETNKNLKVINNSKRFGSAASNFLDTLRNLDLSVYDYVALSDQDDVWLFDKLSEAIKSLKAANAQAYSSDLIAFDNTLHSSFFLKKSGIKKEFDYLFQGGSAGCTYVLTLQAATLVIEKIRGFPTGYFNSISHDWLIYAICRSHNLAWYHDENSYIFYRQHSNNVFGALPGVGGLVFKAKLSNSGWYRRHILSLKDVLRCTDDEMLVLTALSRFNLKDRLWLVFNSKKFRRSRRDVLLLSLLILVKLI